MDTIQLADIYRSDFSDYPVFTNKLPGVFCYADHVEIRLWLPTASVVEIILYDDGIGGDPKERINLIPSDSGIWTQHLEGSWHGTYYAVRVNINGKWSDECPNIEAYAVGVNGLRGMFVDFNQTNPQQWEQDQGPALEHPTNAVIYELHVRDFSISPTSGLKNKGKYLAFTELETKNEHGEYSGIAHLRELGVTHVHLLPVFDFLTVDETKDEGEYNWGYDPLNFNTPEGSYSTNPYDGAVRILEFKKMVQALHDAGIGVIMDVVYNHTGKVFDSWFNRLVPGYFFRFKEDGTLSDASGCGNEFATERIMARNFIISSLKHWVQEYHIDGFRFDLMGVYDIETMNIIADELRGIRSDILLYGEGWTAADSPLQEMDRTVKHNTFRLKGIASFSDDMRDALKGHWNNPKNKGFISGQTLNEEQVKFGIVAATWHGHINYGFVHSSHAAWAHDPAQCVNYVACHDNYTLYDQLHIAKPKLGDDELAKMVMLAGAVLLTSQGIPFIHAGQEMMRTKGGDHNSYRSPDKVNRIDWNRKHEHQHVFNYYKHLLELRKNHPAFRMHDVQELRKKLCFLNEYYQPGTVSYVLGPHANNDNWKWIVVLLNGNPKAIKMKVPKKKWNAVVQGEEIQELGIKEIHEDSIKVEGRSMVVLFAME